MHICTNAYMHICIYTYIHMCILDHIRPLRGHTYLDIPNFRAIFGPISLFRASFDIKNEFGRSKTFRLHPSKLDFDLPELVLGGCPGIGPAVSLPQTGRQASPAMGRPIRAVCNP